MFFTPFLIKPERTRGRHRCGCALSLAFVVTPAGRPAARGGICLSRSFGPRGARADEPTDGGLAMPGVALPIMVSRPEAVRRGLYAAAAPRFHIHSRAVASTDVQADRSVHLAHRQNGVAPYVGASVDVRIGRSRTAFIFRAPPGRGRSSPPPPEGVSHLGAALRRLKSPALLRLREAARAQRIPLSGPCPSSIPLHDHKLRDLRRVFH
jgi:hypothetical protein